MTGVLIGGCTGRRRAGAGGLRRSEARREFGGGESVERPQDWRRFGLMATTTLPPQAEMYHACRDRDAAYDGVFFTAVRTTGIFCRPTCPAKKPRRQNVEFYPTVRNALLAGYRPCKRCRPMEPNGTAPSWLEPLIEQVGRDPLRRWREADLRSLGLAPNRVRRWFLAESWNDVSCVPTRTAPGSRLGQDQGGRRSHCGGLRSRLRIAQRIPRGV